jgi:hypothetical protein
MRLVNALSTYLECCEPGEAPVRTASEQLPPA